MNPSRPAGPKIDPSLKTQLIASDKCSICLEKLSTAICVQLLTCKHIYHLNCIHEWARDRIDCPLCRIDMFSGRAGFGKHKENKENKGYIDGNTMARLVRFK